MGDILLPTADYARLRVSARSALGRIGIGSNPGFTDHDILSRLGGHFGLPDQERFDEWSEFSGEFFRDSLAAILGIELPTTVLEVESALSQVR